MPKGVFLVQLYLQIANIVLVAGIFYSMAIIGPAVGYLIGGEFLKRYTDLYSVDMSRLDCSVFFIYFCAVYDCKSHLLWHFPTGVSSLTPN